MTDLPIVEPWSEEYAKWYSIIHRGHNMFDVARAVVQLVTPHIGIPSNLLDIGAGNGEQTGLIVQPWGMSHENVCCYEPSKGMSDIGRQKYPGMKWVAEMPVRCDMLYGHYPLVMALFNVMNYMGRFPFDPSTDLQIHGGLFVFDTLNAEDIMRHGAKRYDFAEVGSDRFHAYKAQVALSPRLDGATMELDYEIRILDFDATVAHFRTIHKIKLLTITDILHEADRTGYAVLEILKWGDSRMYILRKEDHGPKTKV